MVKDPMNFFFYGSLRTGYWNQYVLPKTAENLGLAKTVKPFQLYVGRSRVPTCVPGGETPLVGEVYSVDKKDSKDIFFLEVGYEHGEFEVELEDGSKVMATIFHHNDPKDCDYLKGGYMFVPSGDYTKVIKPNGERI
jgi:gamma-glutamylcyclotransferase (GGCT)/AIG2-like uncharacterized protein YtfP